MHEIYLYGMILRTNSFLLSSNFPNPDTYSEIKEKHHLPGGETGSAATVLASLGCRVKMDGNHIGINVAETIQTFYQKIGVDISSLTFDFDYEGIEDYIIIDKETRTAFGQFSAYYNEYHQKGIKRWNTPDENDIKGAKAAGIDPFFYNESLLAAEYCGWHHVPFVTIDIDPENKLSRLASVIVVSGEYIRDHLPDYDNKEGRARMLEKYAEHTEALVILTGGSGTTFYGKNGNVKTLQAFKINTVSTLGAGDTFKAACIYGLFKRWEDDEIVRFASACAAVACTKFPLPLYPPTLDEINNLRQGEGSTKKADS